MVRIFRDSASRETSIPIDSPLSAASLDSSPASVERTDGELVGSVLTGSTSAFRVLLERHEATVFGLCRRLLGGDATEAEDLSQETFLRAFRRLTELRDPERFAPWVLQIARSLCRDRVRKRLAELRALEGRVDMERWQRLEDDDAEEVLSAVKGLPRRERRVLELRYFEAMSYQEIAEAMNLSFSRVDHLIRQARARLSRRMQVVRLRRERSL